MWSNDLNLSVLHTEIALPQFSDLNLTPTSPPVCWSVGVFFCSIQSRTGFYKAMQLWKPKKETKWKIIDRYFKARISYAYDILNDWIFPEYLKFKVDNFFQHFVLD